MSNAPQPAPAPANAGRNNPDKYSNAGTTPDPWEACAALEYGADRSFAWSVREQVINTPPEGRSRIEDRLLKALGLPTCTAAGRAFLCQMLALVGSEKSVPILSALLKQANAVELARYALEAIPGPEASAALRAALADVSGPAKAGLIGSIAMRRDREATAALTAIRDHASEPTLVREAARRALEVINAQA
jgi:hypothetical protein